MNKLFPAPTEANLNKPEIEASALLEALPVAVYTTDATGRITYYNQAAAELWGHRPDLGDHRWCGSWRLFWPDGTPLEHGQCPMAIALKEGRVVRGAEAIAERPDGTRVPFLPFPTPLRDRSGAIVGAINMLVDISERKASEEQLRQVNESLEARVVEAASQVAEMQKMETIGQLTGGIAHDFNNVLTPIIGSLDLLRYCLEGNERAETLVANAMESAERAAGLVKRLLAIARRQRLQPCAVDIAALLRGLTDLVQRSIGPSIRVLIDAPDHLRAAKVDPGQLELVILNLAVNARDAMPNGGTLTITAHEEVVGSGHPTRLASGHYVRLSVVDTGTGMDEATLKRAIEPFFTTKEVGKGTGLGLSMAHGLAVQSGGALRLSSTPGTGTRAEVWLPSTREPVERRAGAAQKERPPLRAPRTVLLVDDEALVRTGTAEMLKDLGHRVIEANSATQALEMLRGNPGVELLITDYLMPGMTGGELACRARKLLPNLPIVLITGYASLIDEELQLPQLAKPFRQADLGARIAEVVSDRAELATPPSPGAMRAPLHVAQRERATV